VTAYRTSEAPPETPYVNPHLERALLDLYRKQHRLDFIPFGILVVVTVLLVVWVLTVDPNKEMRRLPLLGVVAGPCAFGSAIMGYSVLRRRPKPLLDRIRTGIPIREVRRDGIAALHVHFADGSTQVLALGNLKQLARIEELLAVQMVAGSAPQHAPAS